MYTPFKYVLNFKNLTISFSLNYWFYLYVRLSFFKTYNFDLYKLYLNVKLKIILKYFLDKMFREFFIFKFSVNYAHDNTLLVKLIKDESNIYNIKSFNTIFKYE